MKLTKRGRHAPVRRQGALLVAGTLLVGPVLCDALAQETNSAAPSADAPPAIRSVTVTASAAEPSEKQSAAEKPSVTTNSPGIAEILKMAQAGVSKDVM